MSDNPALRRNPVLFVVFMVGVVSLVGGVVGTWIERAVITHDNTSSPLPTLPVGTFAVYVSPPIHSDVLNYNLMLVFGVVAVIGLLLLIASSILRLTGAAHRSSESTLA
jgi:hypothetical protein